MSDVKQINLELETYENFYCPVCGKHLVGENSKEDYCEHVLFIFVDAIGEFVHVADNLKEHTDVWHDDDEWDKIEEQGKGIIDYVQEFLPEKSAMTFAIETHGMACGPAWGIDYIAIDFCP